jgi:hypothetical protein
MNLTSSYQKVSLKPVIGVSNLSSQAGKICLYVPPNKGDIPVTDTDLQDSKTCLSKTCLRERRFALTIFERTLGKLLHEE